MNIIIIPNPSGILKLPIWYDKRRKAFVFMRIRLKKFFSNHMRIGIGKINNHSPELVCIRTNGQENGIIQTIGCSVELLSSQSTASLMRFHAAVPK